MMRKIVVVLALAVSVSARASAFVPGTSITKNIARGGAKQKAAKAVAAKKPAPVK